jgi:hypothetical protein
VHYIIVHRAYAVHIAKHIYVENHKLNLLLLLVLFAGLASLAVLFMVPIAGLSSGSIGIFSRFEASYFLVLLAFSFVGE